MGDIAADLALVQRSEVIADSDALAQLAEGWVVQFIAQFRLADQNDLD